MASIYIITCLDNGRYYIGQSHNANQRWRQHMCELKAGRHRNKILQACYDKYGEKSLVFHLICYVNLNDATDSEQAILDAMVASDPTHCMNHRLQCVESNFGIKFSDEIRAKVGAASRGRTHTAEARERIGSAHVGKVVSEDTRKKISEARKARTEKPKSEETKAKMRLARQRFLERRNKC